MTAKELRKKAREVIAMALKHPEVPTSDKSALAIVVLQLAVLGDPSNEAD